VVDSDPNSPRRPFGWCNQCATQTDWRKFDITPSSYSSHKFLMQGCDSSARASSQCIRHNGQSVRERSPSMLRSLAHMISGFSLVRPCAALDSGRERIQLYAATLCDHELLALLSLTIRQKQRFENFMKRLLRFLFRRFLCAFYDKKQRLKQL
jgi:hypothetical protein